MSERPDNLAAAPADNDTMQVATRLLGRIRSELLELDGAFDVDSDLFAAGLDSMAIMQLVLMLEDEFNVKLPDCSITRTTFATARQIAGAVATARAQS